MTIYIETHFAVNWLIDVILLFICGFAGNCRARPARLALSAALGACFAAVQLFEPMAFLAKWWARIPAAFGLVAAAYAPMHPLRLVRMTLLLLGAAALAGGLGAGAAWRLGSGGWSAWLLLPLCACCAGLCAAFFVPGRYCRPTARCVEVEIFGAGGALRVGALCDSGNLLVERATNLPVVICGDVDAARFFGKPCSALPYSGAGGSGLLLLHRAEGVFLVLPSGKRRRLGDCCVAFAGFAAGGDHQAIIPAVLLPPVLRMNKSASRE